MKLLTWNIMHGGGPERLCWIALALLDWAPDVIALTEFRGRRGGSLRGVLADHGWPHQAVSDADAGENGVLIASRRFLSAIDRHTDLPRHLRRRIVSARLGEPGERDRFEITAVHVPDAVRHDRGRMVDRTTVWHELIRTARERRGTPHVILGDLNTGRHRLDEPGETFSCTALLGRLVTMGYTDAWRDRHGSRREGSWIGPAGGVYRLDHALVSPSFSGRVALAEYGRDALGGGLSDHAPLLVELADTADGPCFSGVFDPEAQKTLEK